MSSADRYRGLISGWDPKCSATQAWMQQMNINALPRELYLPADLCTVLRCFPTARARGELGCMLRAHVRSVKDKRRPL